MPSLSGCHITFIIELNLFLSHAFFCMSQNKINFTSLGCPRNLVDSEVMLGILLKAGYEVAPDLPEADYIVINTCGFLEASRKESMDTVEETLDARKKRAPS